MKPLTIEKVKGQKREYTFLGWKDDGLAFYATSIDGEAVVITPYSAYPDDFRSGEPYRFPRIVPLEIIPKQFEIAWSHHHRDVLKRWRKAKLAEVDAETQETLFPFDAPKNPLPKRTPAELNHQRQVRKDVIESRYRDLVEKPLVELLNPIEFPYLLEDFRHGRWADALGKDFGVMMKEASRFNSRWHEAYDPYGDHPNYQGMLSALCSVRLVMRGNGNVEFPLVSVDVQPPTDREAEAYVVMRELLWGKSAPPKGPSKSAEPKAKATKVKAIKKPNLVARFENDFSLAVIPQRKGEPFPIAIEIELQSFLKRIAEAGGRIARTKLCKDKPDGYQPEKLLRSKIAKSLMAADLLGSETTGRTTVFWLKMPVE